MNNKQIEGFDDVGDIILPPEKKDVIESDNMNEKSKGIPVKEAIKKWNESPIQKEAGIIAVRKWTYIGLWAFAGLCFLLLSISLIWFNTSFASKDFSTNIPVNVEGDTNNYNNTINVEDVPDDIDVNVNNYHNITVMIPDEIVIKLINETG